MTTVDQMKLFTEPESVAFVRAHGKTPDDCAFNSVELLQRFGFIGTHRGQRNSVVYPTPDRAIRALSALCKYQQFIQEDQHHDKVR